MYKSLKSKTKNERKSEASTIKKDKKAQSKLSSLKSDKSNKDEDMQGDN